MGQPLLLRYIKLKTHEAVVKLMHYVTGSLEALLKHWFLRSWLRKSWELNDSSISHIPRSCCWFHGESLLQRWSKQNEVRTEVESLKHRYTDDHFLQEIWRDCNWEALLCGCALPPFKHTRSPQSTGEPTFRILFATIFHFSVHSVLELRHTGALVCASWIEANLERIFMTFLMCLVPTSISTWTWTVLKVGTSQTDRWQHLVCKVLFHFYSALFQSVLEIPGKNMG